MNNVGKLLTKLEEVDQINGSDTARKNAINEFGKCGEEQAFLIIKTWTILEEMSGKPDCITYRSKSKKYIENVAPFSLQTACIRFKMTGAFSGFQALIRLARSTATNCKLRDPLLECKFLDKQSNRLIILDQSLTKVNIAEIFTYGNTDEFDDVQPCIFRKEIAAGTMELNEKMVLLPAFQEALKKTNFKHEVEYPHPHGYVDVFLRSGATNILVELKYINSEENPLDKIRKAIGQVLMYKHDPRFTSPDCLMWIVTNEFELNIEIVATLKKISGEVGIQFYQVFDGDLECVSD